MLKQVKSGEIVPVHDIKAHGGSGGIAPFILNIGCRSTFTLRLLDACGEGGRYALHRRLGWSQSRSECFEVEKNILPAPRIEPEFLGRTARSLLTVPNAIFPLLAKVQYPEFVHNTEQK